MYQNHLEDPGQYQAGKSSSDSGDVGKYGNIGHHPAAEAAGKSHSAPYDTDLQPDLMSDLETGWQAWKNEQALRGLTLKLVPLLGVLFLFMYTDITLLHNYTVSLLRLIPVSLAAGLLLIHHTVEGYGNQKRHLYHVLLISLLLMMFARVILLNDDPNLGGSLAGLLLVVLVLSLELRASLAVTMGVYLFTPVLFTIFVFYPKNVWDISYFNIYPMMIAGLVFNVIKNRSNFSAYKSQFMLGLEKQRTEALYHETKAQNEAVNRANQKLRDSEKSLRDALETREKLMSIIAHDIRNPFNVITGYSDIISSESQSLSRQEISEYAHLINNSSHKTLNLIDNLLQWTRSQTGKIKLVPRPHSLSGLLREVIGVMSVQADAKKIRIVVDVSPDLLIETDYATMSTVFRNLLSNAIKFTPAGGSIAISSGLEHDSDGKATSVTVKFKDTGAGFSGQSLDDLIQDNKVTTHPGTENEKGTGLGLMICRDFVAYNNGKLSASSVPGKGSEFVVTLPYRED